MFVATKVVAKMRKAIPTAFIATKVVAKVRKNIPSVFVATFLMAVSWVGFRPSVKEPTSGFLESVAQVPPAVRPAMERACLDCHSSETQWPWYNRLPVVSWLIQKHVDEGREHLDFSAWAGDSTYEPTGIEIQEICDAVSDGTMPLWSYRIMHPDAALSEEDKHKFCAWAEQVQHSEEQETAN